MKMEKTETMKNRMLMIASKVFPSLPHPDVIMCGDFLQRMMTYDLVHDEEYLLFCHLVMCEAIEHVRKVELGQETPEGKYGHGVKALLERFKR